MANTHSYPDSFYENQATWGDLGPQVIVSHSGLTVPASSLTMPSVAANGHVLSPGPPARLVYVSQPAVSVTLSGGNGTFWLALHTDLHTPVAGWTRRAGSHYVWQMNAAQPANPSGGLVFCQVTVAALVISAVSPLLPVTSAPMSRQNSNAVAITGGHATGLSNLQSNGPATVGGNLTAGSGIVSSSLRVGSGVAAGYPLDVTGIARLDNRVVLGVGGPPVGAAMTTQYFDKNVYYGTIYQPQNNDAGPGGPVVFHNIAGTPIGSISTSATATAYNTTSDVRLKHSIQVIMDALARVQALRPVSFRWNADDSTGHGFLAHELQHVIPEAVTGEPEALNADGSIKPQQVDHSKLVPWLTACCQELAQQVQALTARLETLETALGG